MVDSTLKEQILKKCYESYKKTGLAKAEFVFGFDNAIRQNYFDTLDDMYHDGLIKPNYAALGMALVVLTNSGINLAQSIFN